jgi:hypothetical protein
MVLALSPLMRVLRIRISINWQNLCLTPRTGATGPALNSRARRGVRNTSSACAGAAACSRSSARLSSARSPAGRCSATRPVGSGRSGAPRPRRRDRCRGWTSTCRSLSPHGRDDLLSGTHRLRLTVAYAPRMSQRHTSNSPRLVIKQSSVTTIPISTSRPISIADLITLAVFSTIG